MYNDEETRAHVEAHAARQCAVQEARVLIDATAPIDTLFPGEAGEGDATE